MKNRFSSRISSLPAALGFGGGFQFVEYIRSQSGVAPVTIGGVFLYVLMALLGTLSLIGLIMIIIGGFQYMTAAGDENRAQQGKKTMFYAVLGLAAVLASGAIVNFVINAFAG